MIGKWIWRRVAAAAMALGCVCTAVVGAGATAFASVTGVRSGLISEGASAPDSLGSQAVVEHQDEITVLAWDQALLYPSDPRSETGTVKPRHEGYRLVKYVDSASPALLRALFTGELLQIDLRLYRTNSKGLPEQYYTVRMRETQLVRQEQLEGGREELRLVPRRLEQIHDASGTSSLLDLTVPVGISGFSVE